MSRKRKNGGYGVLPPGWTWKKTISEKFNIPIERLNRLINSGEIKRGLVSKSPDKTEPPYMRSNRLLYAYKIESVEQLIKNHPDWITGPFPNTLDETKGGGKRLKTYKKQKLYVHSEEDGEQKVNKVPEIPTEQLPLVFSPSKESQTNNDQFSKMVNLLTEIRDLMNKWDK